MEDTLKAFADACNWINQNTPAKLRNKVRIQGIVYQDVRAKFGLSANLAIRAINRVASNRKTAMKDHSSVKNFEPTSRSKIISNHPLFWLILGSIIDIMSINARKLSHRFFQLVLAPSYSCSCHVQCANI